MEEGREAAALGEKSLTRFSLVAVLSPLPASLSDQPVDVSSFLSGGAWSKIVDSGESHVGTDEFIPSSPEVALVLKDGTLPEVENAEHHPSCMDAEIVDATIVVTSSIQRIESIFRDSLRASWVELCSLVEGRSYEALLAEEDSILASFQALAEFSRQDLTCHDKKLKATFSKARHIKKVQCKAASSKIHDKFIAARASSEELSSKLLHEGEAIARVRATLLQSEDRAARLRQELNELDAHIAALRDQVTSRESMIVSLETEKSESVLLISSLEEIIEKGQGDRLEQLGIELESLCIDLKGLF
ncbi:hypothetical protein LIER_18107 [Lithospermum erythrorhizon]|uniref:Uncharacterized protein n=1 Tax=Lithospermum erythrorhizon TaxID=34254 RepID=A0AAV3QFD2_LITER